ncbi:hypothetical protein LTR17_006377 [Elasticomyces elasticus]|nr:hypothetical protein LTR17_006377 [Elasticomyces elasticus]
MSSGIQLEDMLTFPRPLNDDQEARFASESAQPWVFQRGVICVTIIRGFANSNANSKSWDLAHVEARQSPPNRWRHPWRSWRSLQGTNGGSIRLGFEIRTSGLSSMVISACGRVLTWSAEYDVVRRRMTMTESQPRERGPRQEDNEDDLPALPQFPPRRIYQGKKSLRSLPITVTSITTDLVAGVNVDSRKKARKEMRAIYEDEDQDQDDEEVKPHKSHNMQHLQSSRRVVAPAVEPVDAVTTTLGARAQNTGQIQRDPTSAALPIDPPHQAANEGRMKQIQQAQTADRNISDSDMPVAGSLNQDTRPQKRKAASELGEEEDVEELNDQLREVQLEKKEIEIRRKLRKLSRKAAESEI